MRELSVYLILGTTVVRIIPLNGVPPAVKGSKLYKTLELLLTEYDMLPSTSFEVIFRKAED